MLISSRAGVFRALALSILTAASIQAGTVTVSAVVTPAGGLYEYDYSIANATANDLFDLDIAVAPGTTISDLSAPSGFVTAYDSGLGLVSFLENTASFSAVPLAGFSFESSLAPEASTFTGNLQDLSTSDIVTISGATQAPAVPEPSSLALGSIGALAFLFWSRRWPATHSGASFLPRSFFRKDVNQ